MKNIFKLRKRVLSLLLSLAMCLSLLPATALADEVIGGGGADVQDSTANAYLVPGVPQRVENETNVFSFPNLSVKYKDEAKKETIREQSIFFSNGQFAGDDCIYIAGENVTQPAGEAAGTCTINGQTWNITPIESGTEAGSHDARMRGITIKHEGSVPTNINASSWNSELINYLKANLKVRLTNQELDYAITFGSASSGYAYNAANGHYYTYKLWQDAAWGGAEGARTWANAKALAHKETYKGMEGHLLTITSAEEQAFVEGLFRGQFWTAGTRDPELYEPNDTVAQINVATWSKAVVGRIKNGTVKLKNEDGSLNNKPLCGWFWGDGPESELGLIYYPFSVNGTNTSAWIENSEFKSQWQAENLPTGLVSTFNGDNPITAWAYKDGNDNTPVYAYNNWAIGTGGQEPNDCANAYSGQQLVNDSAHEAYMHVYDYGKWNDYAADNTAVVGFLVEFEGDSSSTSTVPVKNATANISLSQKKEVVVLTDQVTSYDPTTGIPEGATVTVTKSGSSTPETPAPAGIKDPGQYKVETSYTNGEDSYFVDKTVTVIDLATKVTCATAPNTHTDSKVTAHLKDGTYEAKWDGAQDAFVVTINKPGDYIPEDYTGNETHFAKDNSVSVSVKFENGVMTATMGDTTLDKGNDTATDGTAGKYIVPIAALCTAHLTNVTKNVVTLSNADDGAKAVVNQLKTAGITITYPAATNPITLGKGEQVTLLYKITVTGTEGAQYTVMDKEATLVGAEGEDKTTVTSKLSEPDQAGNYTAVYYAYRTFGREDIGKTTVGTGNQKDVLANTVKLTAGDNTDIPDPMNPENPPKDLEDTETTDAGKKFTVTFDGNKPSDAPGTVADVPDPQDVKDGEKAEKPASDPVLPGYKFDGWYTNPIPKGTDSPYDFENAQVTSDLTLYAKWTANPPDIKDKEEPENPENPEGPKVPVSGVEKEITTVNGSTYTATTTVTAGDQVTYQVTITPDKNAGPVKYFSIEDSKMPGGTGVTVNAGNAMVNKATTGNFYEVTPATLDPITITYTYTVKAEDAVKGTTYDSAIVNKVTVKAWNESNPNDPSTEDDSTEINYPVGKVTVSKQLTAVNDAAVSEQPANVKPGTKLTWTITVSNNSMADATGLSLGDVLKAGEDKTAIQPTVTDESGNVVETNYKFDVSKGSQKVFTATYMVTEGDVGKNLVNTAVVSKGTTPEGEVTTPELPVVPKDKAVTLRKAVDKATAKVGETVRYTVTVSNVGEVDLTDVKIADTFNGKGSFTNITSGVTYENGVFTITYTIQPGQSFVFNYEYVVQAEDEEKLTNVVGIPDDDPGSPEDKTPTNPDDPDPRKVETTVEPNDPPVVPKVTGIEKELILHETDVPRTAYAGHDVAFAETGKDYIEVAKGAQYVSLLYRITVTGDEGAQYTVTDEGADAIIGSQPGLLGNTGEAVLYAIKTFTVTDGKVAGSIVNKAAVKATDSTDPDDPGKEDEAKAFQVEVLYKDSDGNALKDPYVVIVPENENYDVSEQIPETITGSDGKEYEKDAVDGKTSSGSVTGDVTITVTYKEKEPVPQPEKINVTWVDGHATEDNILKYLPGKYNKGDTIPTNEYPNDLLRAYEGYTFTGWSTPQVLSNGDIIITANYRTLEVNPDGPTFEELTDLGITVEVVCDTNATHGPRTESYPLMEGSYETIVNGGTCTLIIYNDLYVEAYGGDHSLVGQPAKAIMLEYVGVPATISDDETENDDLDDAASNGNPEDEIVDDVIDNDVDDDADTTIPGTGAEDDGGDEAGDDDGDAGLPGNGSDGADDIQLMSIDAISFSAPTGGWVIAQGYTNTVTFHVRCEQPAPQPETITVTWVDGYTNDQIDQEIIERGSVIPAYPNVPNHENAGYEFTGWSNPVTDSEGNITITANYLPVPTHTVTWVNWNNDQLYQMSNVTNGVTTPSSAYIGSTPTRPSDGTYTYTFSGWSAPVVDAGGNITYTAQFTPSLILPEGPVVPVTPPVTPVTPVTPTPPTTIPDTQTPLDPGTTIPDEEVPLAGAVGLNDVDHFAYIIGYDDDTVRPLNNITRAEVATIFFRLMTDDYRNANWSTTNDFSDVQAGSWYNNAISTCANAGALNGYADGSFKPNASITRAEFAAIAARFLDTNEYTDDGTGDFSDTANHWAAKEIRLAAKAGWVQGDGNKFRPNDYITRAEVMTIVNRMLDRVPDADHMLDTMKKWIDNPEDAWYYEAVQEATNEHAYERDELGVVETWTEILTVRDWKALETEWAAANAQ